MSVKLLFVIPENDQPTFFSSVPAQNTDAPFKIEPENKTVKDSDLGTSITGRFSHFILVYLLV